MTMYAAGPMAEPWITLPRIQTNTNTIQVVVLTGRNTTGPPSRAAPWWITLHVRMLQLTDDDRGQRPLLVCPHTMCRLASNTICRAPLYETSRSAAQMSQISSIIRVHSWAVLLARIMDQYCFAGWRLSSSSVCNAAGARRRARGRSARRRPGASAVKQPTLHGGPVVLRPVRATPCVKCVSVSDIMQSSCFRQLDQSSRNHVRRIFYW